MSKVDLRIDWATREAAKYAVEHWHYSGCFPVGKLVCVGAWEDNKYIGAVVFGRGATSALVASYGLKMEEGCELVRIALTKHKTPVTRIVSICLRFLKKVSPKLRLIVSFADSEQGHHGGIYQGGGWTYTGMSNAAKEYIYKGKRWHGRSFRASHKGMEKHPDVEIVMGSRKHRYLMPLDEKMRAQIQLLALPYPKRAGSIENDATDIQSDQGGATPTSALQNIGGS